MRTRLDFGGLRAAFAALVRSSRHADVRVKTRHSPRFSVTVMSLSEQLQFRVSLLGDGALVQRTLDVEQATELSGRGDGLE